MRIGIPRALLFHRYSVIWKTFFEELGHTVVLSPETNREIMSRGVNLAVDETCLSVKIFLGHVAYLVDRCDMIFLPRFFSLHSGESLCSKFIALNDIVRNTFSSVRLLECSIGEYRWETERLAMLRAGWQVCRNPLRLLRAYWKATHAQKRADKNEIQLQVNLI